MKLFNVCANKLSLSQPVGRIFDGQLPGIIEI